MGNITDIPKNVCVSLHLLDIFVGTYARTVYPGGPENIFSWRNEVLRSWSNYSDVTVASIKTKTGNIECSICNLILLMILSPHITHPGVGWLVVRSHSVIRSAKLLS